MSPGKDVALEAYLAGEAMVRAHPLFGLLLAEAHVLRKPPSKTIKNYCPENGWAVFIDTGEIHVHPKRRCAPAEWAYVLAHGLLHLGLEHFKVRARPGEWNVATCVAVTRLLDGMKFGRAPVELQIHPADLPARPEEALYEELCTRGIPDQLAAVGTAGEGVPDLWFASAPGHDKNWSALFSGALAAAVTATIDQAGGAAPGRPGETRGGRARTWFINHYPLLGALAASFELVERAADLDRLHIGLGAVEPAARRIYINTNRMDDEETRFVMAHEMLHAALQHDTRCRGRDPFLWNVACDYVINHWLVEMGVGRLPNAGGLLDPELKGLSAEAIYDRIVVDLRRYRKHPTFRGAALGDLLGDPGWRASADGMRLDDFYRQALQQGLAYHEEQGRGLLPGGLVEEIRALAHPPIPWDVELARWLDAWFQPLERGRTFARPSRRQSATPDIPRPTWVVKHPLDARTFGVVLDTSGSMWWKFRRDGVVNIDLLARGLGAIASYAMSRDVPAVRVVFCDALPYDQGYLPAEELAGRVRLQGRGGTVLQPAIALLDQARDFPPDAPVLIITDGDCDVLKVRREHAYLMPEGRSLPFAPVGPVFRISPA